MKDQYFGDVNDYRKYGLLRVLVEAGYQRPMVVWMKTEPSGDGGAQTKYLTEAKNWASYDPALYRFLHETVIEKNLRELSAVEASDMIPGARYLSDSVPSGLGRRERYFNAVSSAAAGAQADLVFLDPDNGLATPAMCRRNRRSAEHVYPSELEALAKLPATLLLYQHWPREPRDSFATAFAGRLLEACRRPKVHLLPTDDVLFAVVPAGGLEAVTDRALVLLRERWRDQFRYSVEETGAGGATIRHSSPARPVEQSALSPQIPPRLLSAIESGDCVAFVGAGFSAPAVGTWRNLLQDLAAKASGATRAQVQLFLREKNLSALDYEAAAQVLRDEMGDERLLDALGRRLAAPPANETLSRRLELLRGIPFRAILTTNFDGVLEGQIPGRAAYLSVLRPRQHRWYDRAYWDGLRPGPQVVKLHGDLRADRANSIVLGRRDYRRRLHGDPAYQTFLRAVFATSTVLYLGFSFTDAYLNELRSEVLALLDYRGGDDPIAYALVNDAPRERIDFLQRHEGICTLTYETHEQRDHAGFDRWLEALHEASSPVRRLGRLLAGKRLLWLDPIPDNNLAGMRFLREAAGTHGCVIDTASTWAQAIAGLSQRQSDLVISHWGHAKAVRADGQPCAAGERFLVEMHGLGLRAPVIIFSDRDHATENKREALALGAQAYVFEWSDLYPEIERVFA